MKISEALNRERGARDQRLVACQISDRMISDLSDAGASRANIELMAICPADQRDVGGEALHSYGNSGWFLDMYDSCLSRRKPGEGGSIRSLKK